MARRYRKRLNNNNSNNNNGPVVFVAKLLSHTIVALSVIFIVTILQSSERIQIVSGLQEYGLREQQQQQQQQFAEQDFGGDNTGDDNQNNEASSQHDDPFAVSSGAATNQNKHFQCELIKFEFCASMPYNFARPTNFFGDANQIEAAERARQYEQLAATQCSRHLLAYLCELLAPMCLDDEAMKKFDIYPCRSFCRHVSNDCAKQITALYTHHSLQVPSAFACDRLPYESNGGTGNLHGPCHDTPEINTTSRANNYKPYRKEHDPNIDDHTPIDPKIIRPVQPLPMPPVQQPPLIRGDAGQQDQSNTKFTGATFWTSLQHFGQQLAWSLMRHSNLISILTLICLVLVLNAKRLKRAHTYLVQDCCSKSSTSSSSSRKSSSSAASSVGSELKLAHKMILSPSDSSRSLMLYASCDGKRSKPTSKLVSEHRQLQQQLQQQHHRHHHQQQQKQLPIVDLIEPSQKLLHQAGLGQRTTLINVNGTLERQQQNSPAARYQLIQSLNNQHLAIMENSAKQHQYDYIQVPVGQKQQQLQQQHYQHPSQHQHPQHQQPQPQPQIYTGSLCTELIGSSNYKQYNQCQSLQDSFRSGTSAPSGPRKLSSKASSGSGGGSGQLATAQNEPQLYSNILLSSPSHQVLLFGDESTPRQFSGDSASVGAGARRDKWSKQWANA